VRVRRGSVVVVIDVVVVMDVVVVVAAGATVVPITAVEVGGGESDEVQAVTASSMPRPAVAKRDIGRWYVAVVALGGHWATFIAVPTGR
jgi:hypothetical protein